MKTVFEQYDDSPTAFIEPTDFIQKMEGFPEYVVSTFSGDTIDKYAQMEGTEIIAEIDSVNGATPIYKRWHKNREVAFYMASVGGPSAVAQLEEVIALGGKCFVFFGCCGVLDEAAVDGKIIIPSSAVREEGTSYHYIAPAAEIEMEEASIQALKTCLDEKEYPYIEGKVWTTDAIYRETRKQIAEKRKAGCIAVEMELSALLALTQFRKVTFAQFLYGADSLDGEEWDERDLALKGMDKADIYMDLALETVISLKEGVSV